MRFYLLLPIEPAGTGHCAFLRFCAVCQSKRGVNLLVGPDKSGERSVRLPGGRLVIAFDRMGLGGVPDCPGTRVVNAIDWLPGRD